MQHDITLLEKLCRAFGVMGDEDDVLTLIKAELERLGVRFEQLPFGDLICGHTSQPKVLLAAHVDEVGFMVHKIHQDGTLGITNLGWVKPHLLNETSVVIKTRHGHYVHGQGFARVGMLSPEISNFDSVYVDVGAKGKEDVQVMGIHEGDIGTYKKEFWVNGETVFGSALDNRLGVYALLMLLREDSKLVEHVALAFHTHEEANFEGLRGVVHRLEPQYVLIADMFPVQHAFAPNDTPLTSGDGPAVLYQAGRYVIHAPLRRIVEQVTEVPWKKVVVDTGPIEIEPLAVQGNGTTMATNIFFPVRGYHGPVYSVRISDVDATMVFIRTLLKKII